MAGPGRVMSVNSSTRSNTPPWSPAAARCDRSTCPPSHPPRPASQPASHVVGETAADAQVVTAVGAWVDAALATGTTTAGPLHEPLIDLVETTLMQKVVAAAGGNRTAAAKLLGLDRATLRSKLDR